MIFHSKGVRIQFDTWLNIAHICNVLFEHSTSPYLILNCDSMRFTGVYTSHGTVF